MIVDPIKCNYLNDCSTFKKDRYKCKKCKHNRLRNFEQDCFEEARDNPIPERCPKITYNGPAEQTAGYKCPVCGSFTSPYAIEDSLCSGCGYKLNID